MKWLFFGLSLLSLFVANNALFWVERQYDWFTFVAAGVAISLALLFAWLSGRRFAASTSITQPTWRDVAKTPPATICIFVLLLLVAVGLLKFVAYAHR